MVDEIIIPQEVNPSSQPKKVNKTNPFYNIKLNKNDKLNNLNLYLI